MSAPASHTPGPWEVWADEKGIFVAAEEGERRVARMWSAKGHDLQNAQLIATAPDLLAACVAFEGELATFCAHIMSKPADWVVLEQVRAAIAKAKGHSSAPTAAEPAGEAV